MTHTVPGVFVYTCTSTHENVLLHNCVSAEMRWNELKSAEIS